MELEDVIGCPMFAGIITCFLIILIGLRLGRHSASGASETLPQQENPHDPILQPESDLACKMQWITSNYSLETDPWQRLLTACYRIRVNNNSGWTYIDVCDDFFKGITTFSFDKDARFVKEQFHEYSFEPTCADENANSADEGEYPSEYLEGETVLNEQQLVDWQSDQFRKLR